MRWSLVLVLTASVLGCVRGDLAWSIDDGALAGESARLFWAITPGDCSPLPTAPSASGAVGASPVPEVLPAGTYCFWMLALASDRCELLGLSSETRRLPGESAPIRQTLAPVSADERASYDGLVVRLLPEEARCAPACDPSRCTCSGSAACDLDATESPFCAMPLDAGRVAVSATHACAVGLGGDRLSCWGDGFGAEPGAPIHLGAGELCRPPADPAECANGFAVTDVALGRDSTCVLSLAGHVFCAYGGPFQPVLGRGGLVRAVRLASSDALTCAILQGGGSVGVACWGAPADPRTSPAPVDVPLPGGVSPDELAVGGAHACARAEGELFCWTWDGTAASAAAPIADAGPWLALAAAGDHTCAIDASSLLHCWERTPSGPAPGAALSSVASGSRWSDLALTTRRVCARQVTTSRGVRVGCLPFSAWGAWDTAGEPIEADLASFAAADGGADFDVVCGVGTASGSATCVTVGGRGDDARLGHARTSEGRAEVCP